jgi:hypothetical protein
VLKDFGSILSMHTDSRAGLLAALREIYDGAWTRHVGTDGGQTLGWAGKIGLIAGCTPVIDSHHAVMGSMGERFVLYRLPSIDADRQASRALDHVGQERAMRAELAEAVKAALERAEHNPRRMDPGSPGPLTRARLVRLATLAVKCRSAVERHPYSREVELIPDAELPARISLVLLRLLDALIVLGTATETAWQLVTKCALDSMPAIRRTIVEQLLPEDQPKPTTDVATHIGYPTTTTRRALEDLAAHGVVDRVSHGQGKADTWTLGEWTRERWPTFPEKPPHTGEGLLIVSGGFSGTVGTNGSRGSSDGDLFDDAYFAELAAAGAPVEDDE